MSGNNGNGTATAPPAPPAPPAAQALSVRRLPEPQNQGAALVVKAADRIASALSSMSQGDRDSFTYAMVVAANESDLSKCAPISVLMAAYNSARLGLPPGKAQGLCYFVPFKGECTLVVGFRGWIELATRNNYVAALDVDVVTKAEVEDGDFKMWRDETGPRLLHNPHLDRVPTRDNIVAAYCISHLASGRHQVTLLAIAKVLKSQRDTPAWKQSFDEMAMKTAVHRASKGWRLTSQLQVATALSDADELGASQLTFAPPPREFADLAGSPPPIKRGVKLDDLGGDEAPALEAEPPTPAEQVHDRYRKLRPRATPEDFCKWVAAQGGQQITSYEDLTAETIDKLEIVLGEMENAG